MTHFRLLRHRTYILNFVKEKFTNTARPEAAHSRAEDISIL
jgi:hypothetical protein